MKRGCHGRRRGKERMLLIGILQKIVQGSTMTTSSIFGTVRNHGNIFALLFFFFFCVIQKIAIMRSTQRMMVLLIERGVITNICVVPITTGIRHAAVIAVVKQASSYTRNFVLCLSNTVRTARALSIYLSILEGWMDRWLFSLE